MAQPGEVIEGIGSAIRFVETTEQSDGERVVLEISYQGDGNRPPAHFHPRQTERFEVLEGEVHTLIDGVERSYATGESFEVPPNTVHQMWTDEPARQRWETSPALKTEQLFEMIWGMQHAVANDLPQPEFDLERFADEFRLA